MTHPMNHGGGVGRLEAWNPGRAIASGLDGVAQGALVDIEGGAPALVTALFRDTVELAPLSVVRPPRHAVVRPIGPPVIPAGEDLFGRIIDSLGRPLDGGPPLALEQTTSIFGRDPSVVQPVGGGRLTLGMLAFDLQRWIGRGASLVAVGEAQLAYDVMRHQATEGRICVIATPAVLSRPQITLRCRDLPCIHIAAVSESATAAQWLVPWTAMAIADRLRARGRDVVVLLDDLAACLPHVHRFAARGTGATQLAQLSSRAYAGTRGSASLIARVDAPIIVPDGFDLALDLRPAARGELEAHATKFVQPPIRVANPRILARACFASAWLGTHERAELYAAYCDGIDRARLSEALRIRACLQYLMRVFDSTAQIACLLAL